MQRTNKTYLGLLFAFILIGLCLPLVEKQTGFLKFSNLQGAYAKAPDNIKPTLKGWLNGTYQPAKDEYIRNAMGFHNLLVRIHNQFEYFLFNKANAKDVIVGENGYLFEEHYIEGYFGTDFVGMDSINNTMNRLRFINDTLKKLHKSLLLIVAPSKACFYPEYIPNSYKTAITNTNYGCYLKQIKESGIDLIDFNASFIKNKTTSKYPLEPIHGVHWSMYGAALAGDSLVKYIEKERNINMPHAIWKSIRIAKAEQTDIDIESAMNLLFRIPGPLMAYPEIKFEKDTTKTQPNVLVVGDSFYWGLVGGYDINNGFSGKSDFWYYYKKLAHETVSHDELTREIAKEDVIIIIATAHNWGNVGWGFIEDTYNLFKGIVPSPIDQAKYLAKFHKIKEEIKHNEKWLMDITNGAKEQGIPLDSAINMNARWMIDHAK